MVELVSYNRGMGECVFCKIVSGELPCQKIWEDSLTMAFLDVNPLRQGQTLVVPKKHASGYIFRMPEDEMLELCRAARQVAQIIDKALGSERTVMLVEGLGVNHVHVKLYPVKRAEGEGGLVPVGARAGQEELEKIAKLILGEGGEN